MAGKFNDKVVIITGGAQGIGKKAVEIFSSEGAKVIVWDINEEKGKDIVDESSKNIYFYKVDTTKYSSVEDAAKQVIASFGRIDILINNAGISRDSTLLNMTIEQWQQVIDINLTGVFNCTKAIAPYMVKNNFGRIINTSSLVGLYGNFGQTNYAATKSGVVGITKVWSRELSIHGITVNAVAPGFIETDTVNAIPDKVLKGVREKIPVGRLGRPEEVANAYLFLASEEASYITGSVLNVDGGYA